MARTVLYGSTIIFESTGEGNRTNSKIETLVNSWLSCWRKREPKPPPVPPP